MKELEQFNPKLHWRLSENPELILDLKETFLQNQINSDMAAETEAINAAAENF